MATIVHRVAPAARLIAIKAVGATGTTDGAIAAGVRHAVAVGASVIVICLAGAEPLPRTRRAIADAGARGVVVVAAAGNDGVDIDVAPSFPGGYDAPNLVTVAAADGDGRLLPSSNRGRVVDAVVPAAAVPTCNATGAPIRAGGTSAAAAVMAGRLAAGDAARSARTARPLRCR
jgi:hypothetical protein